MSEGISVCLTHLRAARETIKELVQALEQAHDHGCTVIACVLHGPTSMCKTCQLIAKAKARS